MPIKLGKITKDDLEKVPLPSHGGKYAIIPHKVIIDKVNEELDKAGFINWNSEYTSTSNGNIATGMCRLDHGSDDELKLMFVWSNSYDKTQKFKCAVGAHVLISGNSILSGDMGYAARKHLGTSAKDDAFEFIENQIKDVKSFYDTLTKHKEIMKKLNISRPTQAAHVGRLFIDEGLLTLTQTGVIEKEMNKSGSKLSTNSQSVWDFYNHISSALKESHPSTWIDDHNKLHRYFISEYNLDNYKSNKSSVLTTNLSSKMISETPIVKQNNVIFL